MSKNQSKEGSKRIIVDDAAWKKIAGLLPENWESIASKNGLGLEGKMNTYNASNVSVELKVRTLLTLVASNLTLRFTSLFFAGAGLHNVSHVGIHKWMKKSVPVFQGILALMINASEKFNPTLWGGYIVRAIDATTVQSPGAKGTTARVHYALRLNDMGTDHVLVTNNKVGETLRHFSSSPAILDIADRGYSNPPSIAAISDKGGRVLVRWNFASLPLFNVVDKEQIDPLKITSGMKLAQCRELSVFVKNPNGKQIIGRLLIERLPEIQAQKARNRVHSEKGGQLALAMAPFVMLFTTVPNERLSADMLRKLYRLRWQVELEFKRKKSIGKLDGLPNFRDDTVKAWILAKIILAQVGRRLMKQPSTNKILRDEMVSISISSPWETTTVAWKLLRSGLLAVRFEYLEHFLDRFVKQIHRIKMTGKKARRQIEDFLGILNACDAFASKTG